MPEEQQVADTGSGFIVGTDPKEPPRTNAEWREVQVENLAGPIGTPATPPPPPAPEPNGYQPQHFYTDEDLERVRREEKDKLYGRIQTMDEQLKTLTREREEAAAARQAELDRQAEEARVKEESEMEVRELLIKKEEEWQNQLAAIEARYEQDRAVFERERRFQEVLAYRQARLDQEAEYIIPELRDLVKGNSETEVDASIEEMKQRTEAIMRQLDQTVTQQRQGMRGAAPTAPPVGPMEQMESYETLTPQDIATMDMETYKKFRTDLINATGRQYRGG
jgi:hypothetical protein